MLKKKVVVLLVVVLLVLVPIAVFAISSNGYMSEAEALADRIQWEERNRTQDYCDTVMIASEPVQVDVAALEAEAEALADRIQWEERNRNEHNATCNDYCEECEYATAEPLFGCIFPHLFHNWTGWTGWYQWGVIRHRPTHCRVRGFFCHRDEERHRRCLRCDELQNEQRVNTQYQCF